jgi:starch phosphorylase
VLAHPVTQGTIAYFSMEIALDSGIPTYSGGLGVLAGDTLRAAADLGLPMVGVTLLHRQGYFVQRLDADGAQREDAVAWSVADRLQPTEGLCTVEVEGRQVAVRAWRHLIRGVAGSVTPVLLLDTDLPQNDPYDRRLTDRLYGGDERYRLCQEVILGVGGARMLRAVGYARIARYHMNEGHAALLALELLAEEEARTGEPNQRAVERVKRRCVFTTHTPVPTGHDQFDLELARGVLGPSRVAVLQALGCCESVLNMTLVALELSHYVNGVTRRHGEVSRSMFPGYPIGSITNGVHSTTWTAPGFAALYDRYIPDWRRDSFSLRYALGIPLDAIRDAHREAKAELVRTVNERTRGRFVPDAFTLGFARRATAYKRPMLVLSDPARLRRLAAARGPLQVVFAGKAHPQDADGKALIREIVTRGAAVAPEVRLVYLPDYDLELARRVTAGVDLWLNTPKPPFEASGTSGMKAAHNGVPSLSVLDGWWLEGHVEGVTGWAIAPREGGAAAGAEDEEDARSLYDALEHTILPLHADGSGRWADVMRRTIALNASFFNTHRMLQEYVIHAYQEHNMNHDASRGPSRGPAHPA